jgi:sec-independent protein translocase protein TatB
VLNFSPEKLFLVGVIALLVLGPNRLPQAARSLGRFMATLRRMSQGFQDEVRTALAEPTDMVNSAVSEFRAHDVRRSVREAVTSTFTVPEQKGPTSSNLPAGTPDDPTLN